MKSKLLYLFVVLSMLVGFLPAAMPVAGASPTPVISQGVGGASSSVRAWTGDPAVNVAICTEDGSQSNAQICSDGSGGAIII